MPTITFQVPNGFIKGDPTNPANYVGGLADLTAVQAQLNQPGVYIWGVKNKDGKFCPLYVGQGMLNDCLQGRHYNGNIDTRVIANSKNTLFNLEHLFANPVDFYCRVLNYYNTQYLYAPGNNGGPLQNAMLNALQYSIVYYQRRNHMNIFCGLPLDVNTINRNHGGMIQEYQTQWFAGNTRARILLLSLLETKSLIRDNFYFVFVGLDAIVNNILMNGNDDFLFNKAKQYDNNVPYEYRGPGGFVLRQIEHASKEALEKINLYTYGESANENPRVRIDLTAIQNDLINVGGYVYPDNYGIAGDPPLVIPVPNYPPHY